MLNKGGGKQMAKIKVVLFMAVATLLTFAAFIGSAGACALLHHQEEIPDSLMEKFN